MSHDRSDSSPLAIGEGEGQVSWLLIDATVAGVFALDEMICDFVRDHGALSLADLVALKAILIASKAVRANALLIASASPPHDFSLTAPLG